jgi:hypothetical protein
VSYSLAIWTNILTEISHGKPCKQAILCSNAGGIYSSEVLEPYGFGVLGKNKFAWYIVL